MEGKIEKKAALLQKRRVRGVGELRRGGGNRRGHLIGFTCDGEVSIEYCGR